MHRIVRNLDQFNAFFSQETLHPQVGIGDLSMASEDMFLPTDFGCYCVFLIDNDCGEVSKDGKSVRYAPGTMFTAKPGQVISIKLDPTVSPKGKILVFRKEMIENTGFGRDFYMFNFFDFEIFEALKLTESEKRTILNCYSNIKAELKAPNDELTGHMLRLEMSILLSYCKRYYERQFDTRIYQSSDFIRKLDSLLDSYLSEGSDLPRKFGFPTVAWCADQFNLVPNYFGNLVRRNMHMSAQNYIHNKLMDKAKTLLANPNLSVDNVAETIGFSYSNHFSRLFRSRTGMTPSEFRKSIL